MHLKTKISLLLFSSLFILFSAIFLNTIADLRNASAVSAKMQALSAAKVIEAGLTAHMISGTMNQRDEFLKQISSLEIMKRLWVVRSQKVSHQYGKGVFSQDAQDGIDKSVLLSGEAVIETKGSILEDATVRLSIPYKATSGEKIDCLSCHDVKAGDTLGVISLEMQTNDLKALNYRNILITAILLVLFFALLAYFLYSKVLIYFDRFDAMGECARAVEEGDYHARISDELSADKDAASLNRLVEKFQTLLETMRENLSGLIRLDTTKDPLIALSEGSARLSEINNFSQTLQKDVNTQEVYKHIASHFCEKFDINDVNIIAYDPLLQESVIVHETKQIMCDALSGCRAARTGEIVDSSQPDGICPKMIIPNEHYICFPCVITPTSTLVVSTVSDKKNLLNSVRYNKHIVAETMQGVRQDIAYHQMSEGIKSLERMDTVSGLFNQRYFEERMFQIVKESKRAAIPYGVLVMNVDRFSEINNVFGVKTGDKTLALIGRSLLDSLRESDLIVRTSSDEFVVLLYDCNPDNVASVGEKVRSLFANKKLKTHPGGLIVTMSIGSSIFPRQHKEIAQCVHYARLAMREAKRDGGNMSVKFHTRLLEV
ncbi:MAG: GGDEF domain-containing protein [Pseudomonadota bacterium]